MSSDQIFKDARREYERGVLDEASVAACPFAQFRGWLDVAMRTEPNEGNACALATVGGDGRPSARMVLLKSYTTEGLVFFSNYESRKGQDLEAHSAAALLFYWPTLERQVRIEGHVVKITSSESDSYFYSRPKGAQLSAAVSKQSKVAHSRQELDRAYQSLERQVGEGAVTRPSTWGGYRVVPNMFEFWQGRESRLHDRLRYLSDGNSWRIERLWP